MCFDISDQHYNVFAKPAPDTKKLIVLTFSADFANIPQQACLANPIEGVEKGSLFHPFAGLSPSSLPLELTPWKSGIGVRRNFAL